MPPKLHCCTSPGCQTNLVESSGADSMLRFSAVKDPVPFLYLRLIRGVEMLTCCSSSTTTGSTLGYLRQVATNEGSSTNLPSGAYSRRIMPSLTTVKRTCWSCQAMLSLMGVSPAVVSLPPSLFCVQAISRAPAIAISGSVVVFIQDSVIFSYSLVTLIWSRRAWLTWMFMFSTASQNCRVTM